MKFVGSSQVKKIDSKNYKFSIKKIEYAKTFTG